MGGIYENFYIEHCSKRENWIYTAMASGHSDTGLINNFPAARLYLMNIRHVLSIGIAP